MQVASFEASARQSILALGEDGYWLMKLNVSVLRTALEQLMRQLLDDQVLFVHVDG